MSTRSGSFSLRLAPPKYDQVNEQVARRTIEQSVNQLADDQEKQRRFSDKDASLSLRKYQFLLMGAPNG